MGVIVVASYTYFRPRRRDNGLFQPLINENHVCVAKKNQNLSLHNIVGIIVGPEALAVTATAPRLRGRWDVTIRAQKQKFLL